MSPYLHSLAQWLFLHLPGWILAGYIASLVFIFIYSLSQAHLMLHYVRSRRKVVQLPKAPLSGDLPLVTVQLPVYNEKYVVARLLESVAGLRYPAHRLEIQVLDDSTDETTEIIARKVEELSLNIRHIRREDRRAKQGRRVGGRTGTGNGQFIAIFDADFISKKTFSYHSGP